MRFNKFGRSFFLLLGGVLLVTTGSQVWAAEPAKAGEQLKVGGAIKADPGLAAKAAREAPPDIIDLKKIPLIQNLLLGGAELYYVGERSSMHGFLLYKDGQMQMTYLTPDRNALIFGGMYGIDGADISAQQVNNASAENAQLKALLAASSEQQKDLERSTGMASARDPVSDAKRNTLPAGGGVSLTPGERLMNDFLSAAGVVVGQEGKPLTLMLVDPQCQFCKATWGELYEPIKKGQLRVKLIPIGAEGSENEKQAAKFLRVSDPLNSWNKFVSGDKTILAGDPPAADLTAVRSNMSMVATWKIQATPYIVYRGADGKVKVVQGKPEKVANILSDLKPATP
ncbi:MAG: thioredoxin fold domain-containing protein [Alphaproteobacteria bacterium]|nr:thioredoxin fold domain-containing protein [Alphaproteobacteria bacterium]